MSGIAWTAIQIAALMASDNVVYLANDEQQAEALAAVLRALRPRSLVLHLPASDALPGEGETASAANVGARMATLRAAYQARQDPDRARLACILSGEAAARRYPPPGAFGEAALRLEPGDPIDLEAQKNLLEGIGYISDERVSQPGEMALRGEVFDIFPADAPCPARIDIAAGRVGAIRSYDPTTQLSVGTLDRLDIERASELLRDPATAILDHFAPGIIVFADKAEGRRQRFLDLARDVARASGSGLDAIDDAPWAASLAPWRITSLPSPTQAVPRFAEARSPLAALARFARPLLAAGRALVLAGSERDLRFLRPRVAKRLARDFVDLHDRDELAALGPGAAGTIQLAADQGFVDDTLVLIAAADLLGSRAWIGEQPIAAGNPWAVGEIHLGDVIVHEDHGVGFAAGLEPSPLGGPGGEMIALEYAGGARRLIDPVDAARIWRYGADADAVALDKLDGSTWQKRRTAVDVAIAESARGLTELAETRRQLVAPVVAPDPADYERFVRGFPFNETADQARAIGAVRDDLARGTPMDRLIVGDVGYGKTEVALRAVALTALAGYQVVLAAPTTVLVRQHLESFRSRFAAFGITVAGLSRLSGAAEKQAVKAGLADGSIAIVIGTGAVMAKDVGYAKLGLVIIDEEQRFGATDKARLRGAGDIHHLSMSATPIPRTLQMALVGLQQISVIATPPARRQPIRTRLETPDDARMRSALMREKARRGQSFVVVPRIEDMARLGDMLRRIVPDLHVVEAHGKMPPAAIDSAMVGFARGQGDILLATNIIEAGLDVPRANTMIVWRADRFGLAQLHQLRGRVGRGNRRGEVILLTEGDGQATGPIGARTMQRLRTLTAFDRLGAGFDISARDLDMRGAGDLLGDTQAGHMKLIGIDLYQHLLGLALRSARGEEVDLWTPQLHLGETGALPDNWIPEADLRLALYVRLARVADEAGLDAFEDELVDRFGPIPDPAGRLLTQARLRLAGRAAGIVRIDAGPTAIALTPHPGFAGNPAAHGLVPKKDRLLLFEATTDENRPARVQLLLDALAPSSE